MGVEIHQTALVDPKAKLGENVKIGPMCILGPEVELGDNSELLSQVVISGYTKIAENAQIHPQAIIGQPAQILNMPGSKKAGVEVGRNVVFREHVTVHAGSSEEGGITRIGDDCFFMVGTHVAHDCKVGNKCVFANGAMVAGHCDVEDQVWLGGCSAVHQFCRLGAHSFIGGGAIVVGDVIPYGSVIGNQAKLAGLNIVGMKRRNFPRKTIHDIRAAYRLLFADEGNFSERIRDVTSVFANSEQVMQIVDFIRADTSRPLCVPK